ncbi:ARM repeat-containing protein [Athelia psychrophila]|uniref:Vacuolar protein 8 n=1 Tax=Athelia psychrophila TaxID=1759441 RepID=A0A167WB71_9AGAM|nr:ARM repeat-containing protein [Fibularhizoctonia sp. CBS 109695]
MRGLVANTLAKLAECEDCRGQIVANGGVKGVLALFNDKYVYVRRSAVNALAKLAEYEDSRGQIVANGGVQGVLALFNDKDLYVRRSAADVLAKLAEYEDCRGQIVERVLALFNDKHAYVRRSAANTLAKLAEYGVYLPARIQTYRNVVSEDSRSKIVANGGVKGVLALFNDKDADFRRSAANALAKLAEYEDSRGQIVQGVLALFNDEDSDVRGSAADTLAKLAEYEDSRGQIVANGGVKGVLALFNDKDSDVRGSAANTLAKLAEYEDCRGQIVQGVLALFNDEDSDVRGSAADTLAKLAEYEDCRGQIVEGVLALFNDKDSDVRRSAADTLAKLAEYEDCRGQIVQGVLALFNDEDSDVRGSAADTLAKLAEYEDSRGQIVANGGVQGVLALFNDKDSDVRGQRLTPLPNWLNMRTPEAKSWKVFSLSAMTNMHMSGEDSRSKIIANGGVTGVLALFNDKNAYFRRLAANALAKLAEYEDSREQIIANGGIQSVLALFNDEDSDVRGSAADTLAKLAEYGDCGGQIVQGVLALFDDKDPDVRRSAADTLAKLAEYEDSRSKIIANGGVIGVLALFTDITTMVQLSAASTLAKLAEYEDSLGQIVVDGGVKSVLALSIDTYWPSRRFTTQALVKLAQHDISCQSSILAFYLGILMNYDFAICEIAGSSFIYLVEHVVLAPHVLDHVSIDPLFEILVGKDDIRRRRMSARMICSLVAQEGTRSSLLLDSNTIRVLLERLQDKDFCVQILSLDALAQLVNHVSAEQSASALRGILSFLNRVNKEIHDDKHNPRYHRDATGSKFHTYRAVYIGDTFPAGDISDNELEGTRAACFRCLSHASRHETSRTALLDSGLVYILVDMLRDGYCDSRVFALQHIGDLVQYDDFRDLLKENTFTTPMTGILRQAIRTEQCYLFVATAKMVKHEDIRAKLLKSGFVACLLVTLKWVTSKPFSEELPENFPKLLRSLLEALWSYDDSRDLLTQFGYSEASLAEFGQ